MFFVSNLLLDSQVGSRIVLRQGMNWLQRRMLGVAMNQLALRNRHEPRLRLIVKRFS